MTAPARRAALKLLYDSTDISEDLAPFLKSFSFTDSFEAADDLQITLADPMALWRNGWFPDKGATLKATLRVADWTDEGDTAELYCGQFFIDEITAQGPESTVTIKARSTPVGSKKNASGGDAMRTKKTRAWEATTLKTIAAQIAAEANVKLYFNLAQDISYQRRDQKEQSDLAFLQRLGWEDGGDFRVKLTDKKLIIASQADLEKAASAAKVKPPESGAKTAASAADMAARLSTWSFTSSANRQYRACKVSWYDARKKKNYSATVQAGTQETGQTLVVNQRCESQADAERIARSRLRSANMATVKGSLTMIGDVRMSAGLNIDLEGFGVFDGKYFIDTATHTVDGGGYKTSLQIHRGKDRE